MSAAPETLRETVRRTLLRRVARTDDAGRTEALTAFVGLSRPGISAEAAGIIATLFVLSHLSIQYESDHLAEGYHRLHDYLDGHPEASAIYQAID